MLSNLSISSPLRNYCLIQSREDFWLYFLLRVRSCELFYFGLKANFEFISAYGMRQEPSFILVMSLFLGRVLKRTLLLPLWRCLWHLC